MLKVPRGHAYEATAVGMEWGEGSARGDGGEERGERERG